MKLRKMIRVLALILFAGLFFLSAYMIFSYLGESHAQEAAFDELEEVVAEAQTPPSPAPTADEDSGELEAPDPSGARLSDPVAAAAAGAGAGGADPGGGGVAVRCGAL